MVSERVVIPYRPRAYQREIHDDLARFKVVVAHRRAGKTVSFINHLIRAVLCIDSHPGQFAYVAPTYKMAKRIAWDYAKRYSAAIPGVKSNASELRLEYPNGGRLMLLGAESIHDLRGIYLDGAVLDEYAMMSPRVFPEVILPALMDWNGWAILGGTPLGRNQLSRAYEAARDGLGNWSAFMLRASATGAISADQLEVARANMSADEYAQEFECSFAAVIKGAYYGKLMSEAEADGRVTDVPYNPALGVTVAVDLGMRDAFACWFLQEHTAGGQLRAIDYQEYFGLGLPQVKRKIDALGYAITRWVGPHDLAVRELGTGRSRIEVARELGMEFEKAAQMPIADGIEAVRMVLPMMVFDRKKCSLGIDALRQYRCEWNEQEGIARAAPLHDWTSHCADGLRTYATARSGGLRTNWRESLHDIGVRRDGRAARGAYQRG
jgi:hypothetical protein